MKHGFTADFFAVFLSMTQATLPAYARSERRESGCCFKDSTQILYQLGLGAAAIHSLNK